MKIIDKSSTLATYPHLAKKDSVFGERIDTVKTRSCAHSVNVIYFDEGATNTPVKIEIYANLSKFCEIYDVVVKDASLLVKIFEHNSLDYALIRSESQSDITIVALDTAEVLETIHYSGDKFYANPEYLDYAKCFSDPWADITKIDQDLFLIERDVSIGEKGLSFCRFGHDGMSSDCTFKVVPSEDIVVEEDVDIEIVGDIIEITDCPYGRTLRRRQYVDHPDIDCITRIVNRSSLNACMMINELAMACCDFPVQTQDSPNKDYQISWMKTRYSFMFLHDFGDTDKPKLVVVEDKNAQRRLGDWIISWSDHKEANRESSYLTMKRAKGEDILVVDLEFCTTSELSVPNRVEREETVTTNLEISHDGEKLFVIGNIMGIIPFFSVYKTDLKRDTVERVESANSVDYSSDVAACWEGDKLVINADDDNWDHEFKIQKKTLVRTA